MYLPVDLIVTEKENAARRIADILSDGGASVEGRDGVNVYRWGDTRCVGLSGHVVGVDFPPEYSDWRDVEPAELVHADVMTRPTKADIVAVLQDLAADADRVVIATDYDREGELIGKEAYELVRDETDAPVSRVRFSSITEREVKSAFDDPDEIEEQELIDAVSDEFDGGVDTNIWNYDVGNGCPDLCGWGNDELQSYQTDNVWTENGRLIIEARDETVSNSYGTYDYTSGKITTKDKKLKQFGRIDVRAKLPKAAGVWPAIWMLGNDIDEATWPDCGEIDIMENFGNDWTTSHSTIHGPGYSGGGGITSSYSGPDFSNGFHDFTVTWYSDAIKWFVDGQHYHTVARTQVENAGDNRV